MKKSDTIRERILNPGEIIHQVIRWRLNSKTIAFTNGVFDILHQGHLALLNQAAEFADVLVLGVNSDASVKRLKGNNRPVNNEGSRVLLLASMVMIDAVIIFEEDTPLELIKIIMPHVLVKGGDYTIENIVGAKEVLSNGGEVKIVPVEKGFSTSGTIEKIKGKQV